MLREAFGFPAFRPYQEAVCRAVTAGEDALVVMPTGAGKSLCYQLPGLARAGTTLVISPLIALMEDQVEKLQTLGLAAERIHSGRQRADSREVCRAYLAGRLDYLFIAPERLAVPGFTEFLARRKPVLIAVDEAHCISHWGHDFRPDYRLLGERLPQLRPAPIIALTATATPLVQDDVAGQLGIPGARRFIHGFRRTNIAVEVVEMRPALRHEAVARILEPAARRPAIVYAPTRRKAEELGDELAATLPAATYHAGMAPAARDRVQAAFLAGELQVIVATIAFGMGVDKPDVRTVVHTGLPGTLEGYYQEIGRAGRDGEPSRAILLYSFADRRTHEYFHRKSYPDSLVLERLFRKLGPTPRPKAQLLRALAIDAETFDAALEKLWIHGGAQVDPAENVSRGADGWQEPYRAQSEHRLAQLAQITRFAETPECRMLHLVSHFGDREDSGQPCGICDVCDPAGCVAQERRPPTADETAVLERAVDRLRQRPDLTTGQLYQQCCPSGAPDRRTFERLLGGLVRAGLAEVREDSFHKGGREIHFRRASLSAAGYRSGPEELAAVRLEVPPAAAAKRKTRRRRTKRRPADEPALEAADPQLVDALKAWRLKEAHRRRIPAFRIMPDRTLLGIAAARPRSEAQLLAVKGMGPTLVKKYGRPLIDIVGRAD
ncbi:MAG: ATP-dependent DNA helicase RecQ [Acidobacteria bacterium]|nr:MAG: ATP-dependent DNA helicase RecQ [Acidobacteriota bacterium]